MAAVLWAAQVATVSAASTAVAQGFAATAGTSTAGTIVSAQPRVPLQVEPATLAATNMVGVIGQDPLLTLSEGVPGVRVIIGGTADTLVSDINGAIKAGDRITASPIAGVGMKATASAQIIGTAATNFDTGASKSQTISDKGGKQRTVHIEELPVQIAVSYYAASTSNFLPPFVQNAANAIAGTQVSLLRVFAASIVSILGAIGAITLVSSAVRSGIIALGRNPLAAGAIRRGLLEVGGIVVLLAAFTVIVADLILTL